MSLEVTHADAATWLSHVSSARKAAQPAVGASGQLPALPLLWCRSLAIHLPVLIRQIDHHLWCRS